MVGVTEWGGRSLTIAEREAIDERIRRRRAAFMAEAPTTCPWLGHRDLIVVFNTNRRSWLCLTCRREFTPGA